MVIGIILVITVVRIYTNINIYTYLYVYIFIYVSKTYIMYICIYIYIYIYNVSDVCIFQMYTIKLFSSLIKCSISYTIEQSNWIMVKIQLSFQYLEFHVNYFTLFSLITTPPTDVTKSLQCKGFFLNSITWRNAWRLPVSSQE